MTRAQQYSSKNLDKAIHDWLLTYNWRHQDRLWFHQKIDRGIPMWDAFMVTWADKTKYGW